MALPQPAAARIPVAAPAERLRDVLAWHCTGNRLHPALKPVIGTFTRPGDVVLDPFCGSGKTLLAAKIMGRCWVGVEVDAARCATAHVRLWLSHKEGNLRTGCPLFFIRRKNLSSRSSAGGFYIRPDLSEVGPQPRLT